MTTYTITGSSTVVGSTAGDTFNLSGTVSNTSLTGSDTTAVAGSDTDQFFIGTATLTGGVTIDGAVGSDYLYLSYGGTTTLANGQLIVKNIENLSGTLNVTGNSTLDLTGSPTAAMGQINAADAGNFLFTGSAGGDVVYAGGGSDTIYGGAGSDTFYAGSGAGRYYGGAAHDNLYFVAGADVTGTYVDMGAASIDAVGGTSELDYVFFSTDYTKPTQVNNGTLRIDNAQAIGYWLDVNGNSTVDLSNSTTTGSGMNNWINLNDAGNAGISGTQAYDIIYINGGSDTVCAQGGTDVIYVGSGVNHVAKGGAGADQFYLYNNDYIGTYSTAATKTAVYTGDVRIDGGTEADVAYLSNGADRTVIQGGSLVITNVEQISGYLQMNDTAMLDVSQATSGNLNVVGDNTANVIYGSGGGSDDVTFGTGNDYYFWSGKATGSIRGGNGTDTFAYMVGGVRTVTNAVNGDGYVTMPGGATIYYYGFENFVETTTSPVPTPAALPPCPSVPIPNSADGIVDGLETGQLMGAGFADAQNDIIDGADGVNDIIKGNGGNDTIDAGAGNDTVYGGNDNDVIAGGAGNDSIYGDAGSDTLSGGLGNDTLDGGLGDDDIAVGGADSALGGSGDDVFTLDSTDTATDINTTIAGGETGEDTIDPSNGGAGDVLDLSAVTAPLTVTLGANPESGTVNGLDADAGADITFSEIEKVLTGTGADSINGSAATTALNVDTGAGNDTIAAGTGNDTIAAGAGNDTVDAGAGNDLVYGGTGNDTVAGGAGNDTIYGGDGADSLSGGAGNDTIYGDLGDDDLILGAGDAAFGGSGDDVFTFDPTLTGNATITLDGGTDATSGNPDDAANGDAGDVLDLRGLSNVVITYGGGNNEAGTVTYKNAANEVVTVNFSEIESILRDPPGVVDGTAGNDTMGPGFTDAQGDQIDGADGVNDTVAGGVGNDTIDAGQGDDTVYGGDGTDSLSGGVGNDLLYGGNDNDTVLGGTGSDTLYGDAGADSLDGGADNDLLYGGDDNDTLLGGAGNDSLFGDAGSDSLTGGAGNDTLDGGLGDDDIAVGGADVAFGGSGDDVFTLDATDTATDVNATITGGELGEDLTDPSNGGTGDSLDLSAITGPLTVVYGANPESGTVNGLDADAGADITFSQIEKVLTGTGSDSINASAATGAINIDTGAGNDTIATGSGDNTVAAGSGNDSVDSGAGNDLVYGGAGSDTLTGGTGNDTLYGDQGDDDILAGAGDALFGGSGDDVFTFDRTQAGNATITLDGGSDATSFNPDDTANGDAGDILDLRGQTNVNITYNTADPTYNAVSGTGESGVATYTNSAGQTVTINFTEIETIQRDLAGPVDGTVGDDAIGAGYKDGQNDQIDGTDGANDIVYGGLGNDSIAAGLGNDIVYGGSDNDTLDGWVGSDVLYGGDGNDLLKDSDANRDTIYGGAGDDIYDPTGNGSASDVVYLDSGNDRAILGLIQTGINESIDGGSGNDTFDYSSFPTNTINVTIRPDGSLDFGGTISTNNVYTNFENITGNSANNVITGNQVDNVLDGGAGADTLTAGAGNDTVLGGTGNDLIYGGDGSDTVIGGAGNDTLYGDLGDDDISVGGSDVAYGGSGDDVFTVDTTDTATNVAATIAGGELGEDLTDPSNGGAGDSLDLSAATGPLTVVYGANPESGTVNGLDADAGVDITFSEIERVFTGTGSDSINASAATGPINVDTGAGNDTISTGAGDNTVTAGTGNDVVDAGAGNDLVYGGDGNDSVAGGTGNDLVYGGDGSDTLAGGAGSDVLDGGLGDDDILAGAGDTVTGGSGDDVFTFEAGLTGNATISVDGGTDATSGNPDDTLNGDAGDVLDLRGLTGVVITYGGGNNEAGTATYKNAANETVTINFTEIETVLRDPAGTVDGTAGSDSMGPGFTDPQGDQIDGTDGLNDTISAGAGNDTVDAGQGADTVSGGDGNDSLYGNVGNDSLLGGTGNDSLLGGDGSDTLAGGVGNDTLDGGLGDDDIAVGGADVAFGGSGDDVFTIDTTDTATDLNTTITGGETGEDLTDPANGGAGDVLDLSSSTAALSVTLGANPESGTVNGLDADAAADITFSQIEKVVTGTGADTIAGASATGPINADTGAGNDSIATGSGNDTIAAGDGNDTVDAGAGDDSLSGGAGNDSMAGGAGNDTLDGGDGTDTLIGGEGNDTLTGGLGDDRFTLGAGDTADGGSGDDFFSFDKNLTGATAITVTGGETGQDLTDPTNGGAGDILSLAGLGPVTIVYDQTDPSWNGTTSEKGVATYTNAAGQPVTINFSQIESVVVCFTAGTMIDTAEGEKPIESLQPGDLVRTADHDYQPIRWIGSSLVPARGAVAPILIKAGALGNTRDLRVSPQHRMLLGGWQAEMLFGDDEVLVAAKHLVNDQTILRVEGGMVEYFHMLFDTHEIVFAEGAPSESFHPGQEGWGALAEEARAEILALFPALEDGRFDAYGASARRTLKAHEAKTAVGLIF